MSASPDPSHLLIPFASLSADPEASPIDWSQLSPQALPNLAWLLARLQANPADIGAEDSLSPPHERALAKALGLPDAPDGLIPWAAWQAEQTPALGATLGKGWAWMTPCHWQIATSHVAMDDPARLQLTEAESRALLAAMRPYLLEDGLAVHYVNPTTWLAQGDLFSALPTAALDRVAARKVDDWLPRSTEARALRRLQNEMQMLLYTHPVNDERSARRLPPVNSFWLSGTGALTASPSPAPHPTMPSELTDAARTGHIGTWLAAWKQVDASACAALRERLNAGQPVQLTLCGERGAQRWHSGGTGLGLRQKFSALFNAKSPASVLQAL